MFWNGACVKSFCSLVKNVVNINQLRDVQIKIIGIRSKEPKNLEEIEGDEDIFVYLKLVFGQDRCDIQLKGINVATMNTTTHHALMSLSSKEKIRYEALVPQPEFKQKSSAAVQSLGVDAPQMTCSMNIQLFGVRSTADTVAKELSKHRLFLQHPHPMPFTVTYENPQYFSMVGSSFTNGAVLPPISAEVAPEEIASHPPYHSEELDHDSDELVAVINDLPSHDYLREAAVDKRIKTSLLR
jgi:SWI/SNF-related matrix-associated actin-dependent regulator of chromatin subfamily A3